MKLGQLIVRHKHDRVIYVTQRHYPKAGEGIRTLDIQLGKLTLYQLSYTRSNALLYKV
jgi:hypothetical protein